jgi:hypothetical protein
LGERECREEDVKGQDVDLRLPDKLEYRVNHEKWLVETSDPAIYMRDRGRTPEPYIRYFTLHWHGREIPVRVESQGRVLGRNDSGQWLRETHWTVLAIGRPDYANQEPARSPYQFKSRQEYICAANLILRALNVYGGTVNYPRWNLFREFRKITAELSRHLKADVYGELH